jgi:hypothetical protein
MFSPPALRATATAKAHTQTTSEIANRTSAVTIARASTLPTPAATGNAVSAKTTLVAHDARMIARPGMPCRLGR